MSGLAWKIVLLSREAIPYRNLVSKVSCREATRERSFLTVPFRIQTTCIFFFYRYVWGHIVGFTDYQEDCDSGWCMIRSGFRGAPTSARFEIRSYGLG